MAGENFRPTYDEIISGEATYNSKIAVHWQFMQEVKSRIKAAYKGRTVDEDVLRKLDKFNYCRVHKLMLCR